MSNSFHCWCSWTASCFSARSTQQTGCFLAYTFVTYLCLARMAWLNWYWNSDGILAFCCIFMWKLRKTSCNVMTQGRGGSLDWSQEITRHSERPKIMCFVHLNWTARGFPMIRPIWPLTPAVRRNSKSRCCQSLSGCCSSWSREKRDMPSGRCTTAYGSSRVENTWHKTFTYIKHRYLNFVNASCVDARSCIFSR